jgi:hypothetical protein
MSGYVYGRFILENSKELVTVARRDEDDLTWQQVARHVICLQG